MQKGFNKSNLDRFSSTVSLDLSALTQRDFSTIDFVRSLIFSQGFKAVFVYRLQSLFVDFGFYRIALILATFNQSITGAELLVGSRIEGGLVLRHPAGVVIGGSAIIGKNCEIQKGVVIGEKRLGKNTTGLNPKIGHNVFIGANSVILGDIEIGNNAVIGAMTLVLSDIANGMIAVGIPAKVINQKENKWDNL